MSHRLPGAAAAASGLSHTLNNKVVGDDRGQLLSHVTNEETEINRAVR